MLSPMMQHYLETKNENPDCVLFYRLGDFYEMFFDDAVKISKELDLALTGKECGLEERAPMCGVPFHAADSYINKLVEKGYKVAIAEQVEDPKQAKGLVKREVVKIITPGTNLNLDSLDSDKNNYVMSIYYLENSFGISFCDISTGEFLVSEVESASLVIDEIDKYLPSEIVYNNLLSISSLNLDSIINKENILCTALPSDVTSSDNSLNSLYNHFNQKNLRDMGLEAYETGALAASSLLWYLKETQKSSMSNITEILPYKIGSHMIIDNCTRRNLELIETMRDKEKRGSLCFVLDQTKTAMGGRLIRKFITEPLIDKSQIIKRQNAVEYFYIDTILREEIREYLNPIRDLERLMARVSYGGINPREMLSFATSLSMIPHIKNLLKDINDDLIKDIYENLDDLNDVTSLIDSAISEDAPLTIREGGIIKPGFNEKIDELRVAKSDGKKWLLSLEEEERERTGIKSLKIKYSRVFGYCVEVSNSFKDKVPEDYIRRQTLTNAERYTLPRLKEMEEKILGAEDRLKTLEYDLYIEIRDILNKNVLRIKNTANAIAMLDVITSLSDVAIKNKYVRPSLNEEGYIKIIGGRHPVVESLSNDNMFIKNDTYLDNNESLISIITGPNMAGKSTYMRQTALIVLMAQIGSFVPVDTADISICDRIFTRVGASDDLSSGQSTFMVEMNEVANIIKHATKNSLLILDEIGRGTSTYDGLAIAWSVVEYISKKLRAKTLFATHYHELTDLEGNLDGVQNYLIAVKEQGDDIVFLRKIVKGGADKSYGIQVAKLAGLPEYITERAKEIVNELVSKEISHEKVVSAPNIPTRVESSYDNNVLNEIKNIDMEKLTPLEALNKLYTWQNELKDKD